MQIVVNGEPHRYEQALTVAELVSLLGFTERRLAVEVNREIVPRSRHAQHRLGDGDVVELVQAMGGG
jgi:sulfur carrier protein